jgi:hypothetical protein
LVEAVELCSRPIACCGMAAPWVSCGSRCRSRLLGVRPRQCLPGWATASPWAIWIPFATGATSATPALLWAPPGVSGLLCSLCGTGHQAVEGLGLSLSESFPAGTVHWASGCLRNLAPPALSRAAAGSPEAPEPHDLPPPQFEPASPYELAERPLRRSARATSTGSCRAGCLGFRAWWCRV